MLKKILLVGLAVALLVSVGGSFWARSVFTGDRVQKALADQVSKAIGQPVAIGRLGVSLSHQLTITLGDVAIGEPGRITASELQVSTALRALLSRRIEHATLRVTGAKIALPLPEFSMGAAPAESAAPLSAPPVELVSIDEVVLHDVEVASGGKTVRADIELVPQGTSVIVRRVVIGPTRPRPRSPAPSPTSAGPKASCTSRLVC